jgi:organic radical activating enzyme
MKRGLKAVILTGGGEPTAYKHFNELVRWITSMGLSVALITNGTLTDRVDGDVWRMFSWIRVSINMFEGWQEKIFLPLELIDRETTIGCSLVMAKHEIFETNEVRYPIEDLKDVSMVADNCGAEYIRVLPDCLLPQDFLEAYHESIKWILVKVDDPRFFHQNKNHVAPQCGTCHQAYFRPYLSEQDGGTVYPCDSVVLNDGAAVFMKEYALCKPDEILEFLDGKIPMKFNPIEDCKGCVFTENINMLDNWRNGAEGRFHEFPEKLTHEEFV